MCGVVERALCGGCNGGLYCLCTASYTVVTRRSAVRHQKIKLPPVLHVKLQPVIRKTATLYHT